VFLSERVPYEPMTPNGVKLLFQRLSTRVGFHVHAHQMRHTWATRLAEAGVSPYDLMVAGGWSSLDMVMVYFTAREQEAITRLANAVIRG
jgi:integrase